MSRRVFLKFEKNLLIVFGFQKTPNGFFLGFSKKTEVFSFLVFKKALNRFFLGFSKKT